MKKIVLSLCFIAVMAIGSNSWAALHTLTFDGTQALTANTIITNQYTEDYGITFYNGVLINQFPTLTGLPANSLFPATLGTPTDWIDGENGSQTNWGNVPTSNFIGFNKNAGQGLNSGDAIYFNDLVNDFSLDLFRSGTSGTSNVAISLYNTLISNSPIYTYTTTVSNTAWQHFSYNSSEFNLAVLTAGDKRFLADNISYNTSAPVPIPPAVFLFGSGLSGLFFFRRKKFTA